MALVRKSISVDARRSPVRPDLLVLGGGMAGMAAAARAAEAGAQVAVVEKSPGLGGSAALSAGILWTAPDFRTLRRIVGGGDPELGRALVDGFQPAVTFPFGGLAVDADGRVLDGDGAPVPGLLAAGADAGGIQDGRDVSGLVLGAVFGPRAALAALGGFKADLGRYCGRTP